MLPEGNYFLVNRKIKDHWIWDSSEPFDKRSAWIDIIMSANWKDEEWKRTSKETVLIKRGAFPTSELKLSTKWKWDRGKVRRFLKKLEDDEMIEKTTTKNYIIIFIKNYESYQFDSENTTTNTTTNATTNTTTNATTENVDMTSVEVLDTTTNTTTNTHRTEQQIDHAINNINKLNKDIYIKNKPIYELYENLNFGFLNSASMTVLNEDIEMHGAEKVEAAMKKTAMKNIRSWGYVQSILKDLDNKGGEVKNEPGKYNKKNTNTGTDKRKWEGFKPKVVDYGECDFSDPSIM